MTCRELIEFLGAYLDGELAPAERARFEEHLAECPECVAYVKTCRDAITLSKASAAGDPIPGGIPERLVRAIRASRRRS
jgi:anti-sigma factor (TIGR02949 family)